MVRIPFPECTPARRPDRSSTRRDRYFQDARLFRYHCTFRGGLALTAKSLQVPGTPLSSCSPRSWHSIPEPATRSVCSLPSQSACTCALVIPLGGANGQHFNPVAVRIGDEHRVTWCDFEGFDTSLRKTSYEQLDIGNVDVQGHVVHLLATVDVAVNRFEEVEALHATAQEGGPHTRNGPAVIEAQCFHVERPGTIKVCDVEHHMIDARHLKLRCTHLFTPCHHRRVDSSQGCQPIEISSSWMLSGSRNTSTAYPSRSLIGDWNTSCFLKCSAQVSRSARWATPKLT